MADDIAEFVRGEPRVHCYREIMKPEFGFSVAGLDVNVRWFVSFIGIEVSFIGIEEGTIRTPSQDCRHISFLALCPVKVRTFQLTPGRRRR
jgi:hypothetical protein